MDLTINWELLGHANRIKYAFYHYKYIYDGPDATSLRHFKSESGFRVDIPNRRSTHIMFEYMLMNNKNNIWAVALEVLYCGYVITHAIVDTVDRRREVVKNKMLQMYLLIKPYYITSYI
jgi:hypothetical protein